MLPTRSRLRPRPGTTTRLLSAALLAGVALIGRQAAADPLDGAWTQGQVREDYTVHQWLKGCGPAPKSGSVGKSQSATIRREGDEIAIMSGGRVIRSNECYDPMPTLSRESHSRDPSGKLWRTRCTTPPSDPRRAMLQTLFSITDDKQIDIVETGRYEIVLKEGRCIADVKRSVKLVRVTPKTAPTKTAGPKPTPTPTPKPDDSRCATPGDPARLEVRPSRKLMRAGESFAFHAIVVDRVGCRTHAPVSWRLQCDDALKSTVTLTKNGMVNADAASADGACKLTAVAADHHAEVELDVVSPERYEDLLAQSGLNEKGETDEAAIAIIAAGSVGAEEARIDDGSARRRTIFFIIIGAVTALLGAVAFIGWRRARKATTAELSEQERHEAELEAHRHRKEEREREHARALAAHEESVRRLESSGQKARVCPTCQEEYDTDRQYCPKDGAQLVDAVLALESPAGLVCPACGRGYAAGQKTCLTDGEELVPHALRGAGGPAPAQRGKICPTCGDRFEGDAEFCGKDGTALVLLN